MRKLADRYHKPTPPKFLEQLTAADAIDFDRLKQELANVTAYRKVSLANALLYRQATPESIVYNIRNGTASWGKASGRQFFFISFCVSTAI